MSRAGDGGQLPSCPSSRSRLLCGCRIRVERLSSASAEQDDLAAYMHCSTLGCIIAQNGFAGGLSQVADAPSNGSHASGYTARNGADTTGDHLERVGNAALVLGSICVADLRFMFLATGQSMIDDIEGRHGECAEGSPALCAVGRICVDSLPGSKLRRGVNDVVPAHGGIPQRNEWVWV